MTIGKNTASDVEIPVDVKPLESMSDAQKLKRRGSGFSNFAISGSIVCNLAGAVDPA